MTTKESQIEQKLIDRLEDLKYVHRTDIRDKSALEQNFRRKFEALNRVSLTDAEFARLRDEITTADVFTAAQTLREKGKFTREDGTPLEYTLVNIKEWCKNDFEVINQLCINTDNSHQTLQHNLEAAVQRTMESCEASGHGVSDHFRCVTKMFMHDKGQVNV